MTRYTFVLLVCRTVGVLSAVYLITHIVFAFDNVSWALHVSVSPPSLVSLPFAILAIALIAPLAGVLVGLYADRIASAFAQRDGTTQPAPMLTALAIAAVVSTFYCIVYVGEAQLVAIDGWRYSALLGLDAAQANSDYFRTVASLRGRPPNGTHELALAAGFAVCLLIICLAALRTQREIGTV